MKPISPFIFTTDGNLKGNWAYMLTQSMQFRLGKPVRQAIDVTCEGHHIASAMGSILTIHAGYAWDGMSCWSESPTNILASLAHDVGYQIGRNPLNQWTRAEIDRWLLDLLRLKNDDHAKKCYLAVRLIGWKFYSNGKDLHVKKLTKSML